MFSGSDIHLERVRPREYRARTPRPLLPTGPAGSAAMFTTASPDGRPRLIQPNTRRARALAPLGLLQPLSELPAGYELGPAGRIRKTTTRRAPPAPAPAIPMFSTASRDGRPRLIQPNTRRARELAARGLLQPLSELPAGYEVGPAGRIRKAPPPPLPPRPPTPPPPPPPEFTGPECPTIFRDVEGRPRDFIDFPISMKTDEADDLAAAIGLTAHRPPTGLEPYASPWGTPVIMVVEGSGPKLFRRVEALQALVDVGGVPVVQMLDPLGIAGRPLVIEGREAWTPPPRGAFRGVLSVRRLGGLEKVFAAIRSRGSAGLSPSYLISVAPTPPGPAPGLGGLRRLQTSRAGLCILDRVREALENPQDGRRPGAALLEQRAKAFETWAARLKASGGFSLESDWKPLERAFGVVLAPVDIAGAGIYKRPGKELQRKALRVEFLAHNGHAFRAPTGKGGALALPVPTRSATWEPGPSRILNGQTRDAALLRAVEGLTAPALVHVLGESRFIISEERETETITTIYRPAEELAALEASAQFCAQRYGGKVETLEAAARLHPGTAGGFRFKQWTRAQGIRATPEHMREAWRAANHEAQNWNGPRLSPGRVSVLDMKAAYLSHDSRKTKANGGAADLVARFGWPSGRMLRAGRFDPPQHVWPGWDGFDVCGAVRLTRWEIPEEVPEVLAANISAHLAGGWVVLPDLLDLLQAGELVGVFVDLVAYDADPLPALKFPTGSPEADRAEDDAGRAYHERNEGVHGVGRCVSSGGACRRSVFLTDEAEGRALVHAFHNSDQWATWLPAYAPGALVIPPEDLEHCDPEEDTPDPGPPLGCWVSFETGRDEFKNDTFGPLRAFVLGYHAVALRRVLRRFGPSQVVRVATDSIAFEGEPPEGLDAGPGALWGEWRHKVEQIPNGAEPSEKVPRSSHNYDPNARAGLGEEAPPAPSVLSGGPVPRDLTWAAFCRPVMLCEGVAGGAKTSTILKTLGAAPFLAVGPSHQRRKDLERATGKPAQTFHAACGVLPAPPGVPPNREAAWAAEQWAKALREGDPGLLQRLDELPPILVLDEVGQLGAEILGPVLKELRRRGRQVFASYGGGQLAPPSGSDPCQLLLNWAEGNCFTFETHARATCPELRALADEMANQETEAEVVAALAAAVPASSVAEMLAEWHPRDVVMTSTHAERKTLEPELHARHLREFPDIPARVVYRPPGNVSRAERVPLPDGEGLTLVNPCRGDTFEITAERLGEGPLPSDWAWATAGTIHATQGETIEPPARVWIASGHLGADWCLGAAYTAATRARLLSQLRRVPDVRPREGLSAQLRAEREKAAAKLVARRNENAAARAAWTEKHRERRAEGWEDLRAAMAAQKQR